MTVNKLGPILSANIDFGDLTFFVGPQATGKSILLQLIKLVTDKNMILDALTKYGYVIGSNISSSIQQKMIKDKLTASVTVEDIFNISRYPIAAYNPNVDLYSINKHKTRYARIAMSYAFAKSYTLKNSKDLRKENRTE